MSRERTSRSVMWVLFVAVVALGVYYASHEGLHSGIEEDGAAPASAAP